MMKKFYKADLSLEEMEKTQSSSNDTQTADPSAHALYNFYTYNKRRFTTNGKIAHPRATLCVSVAN
jgi:hypothetical protein